MRMRSILAVIALVAALCACSSSEEPASRTQVEPVQVAEPKVEPWAPHELPEGTEYSILSDRTDVTKRSVDVRLNKPERAAVVRMIAENIKNDRPRTCDQTFITFYLPGMRVGSGAWATAHSPCSSRIAPVSILGMTAEQYAAATAEREPRPGETSLGVWVDNRPYSGVRMELVKRKGQFYLRSEHKDGSSGETRLRERKHQTGRRFADPSNEFGEYYLLTPSGALQMWDGDGLIYGFAPVRRGL